MLSGVKVFIFMSFISWKEEAQRAIFGIPTLYEVGWGGCQKTTHQLTMAEHSSIYISQSDSIPQPDIFEVVTTLVNLRKTILNFHERFGKSPRYLILSEEKYSHLVFDALVKKNSDHARAKERIRGSLSLYLAGENDNIRAPDGQISINKYSLLFEGIPLVVIPGKNITELLDSPEDLSNQSDFVEYSEEQANELVNAILRKILGFTDNREYSHQPRYVLISPENYRMLELHCRNKGAYSWRTAQGIYDYLFGRYTPGVADIVVYPQCTEPMVVLDPFRQYTHSIKNNPA